MVENMSNVIEKNVIKTEVVFSEDKAHRYLLRKEWDKNKPKAMVIMINPSVAGEVFIDHTTMYVMNNLFRLDFGGVDVVNLFSNVSGSRSVKESTVDGEEENYSQILQSAEKVSSIIIAWGKIGESNKSIHGKQKKLLNLLQPYVEKLFLIGTGSGEVGFHPLAPQIRSVWNLVKSHICQQDEVAQKDSVKQKNDIKNEKDMDDSLAREANES